MGNTVTSDQGVFKKVGKVVTILRVDGSVMEIDRRLRVAELLENFPGHFVCRSEALGVADMGMTLHPHKCLKRGRVYFLLPTPDEQPLQPVVRTQRSRSLRKSLQSVVARTQRSKSLPNQSTAPGPHQGTTIKMVMSKQQLAQILVSCSINKSSNAAALLSTSSWLSQGPASGGLILLGDTVQEDMSLSEECGTGWGSRWDSLPEPPAPLLMDEFPSLHASSGTYATF